MEKTYQPYLRTFYRDTVVPALRESRGYKNIHEVPKVEKVVINSGIGVATDKSAYDDTVRDLGLISGQKAVLTKARKSISNFKLREGVPIGAKVTLRGDRMYDFLFRFLSVALPGIRDFRGVPTKLDGQGNYTIGISDDTIFPEISVDGHKHQTGMDITIVTTATTDDDGRELLQLLGMPFRKRNP